MTHFTSVYQNRFRISQTSVTSNKHKILLWCENLCGLSSVFLCVFLCGLSELLFACHNRDVCSKASNKLVPSHLTGNGIIDPSWLLSFVFHHWYTIIITTCFTVPFSYYKFGQSERGNMLWCSSCKGLSDLWSFSCSLWENNNWWFSFWCGW